MNCQQHTALLNQLLIKTYCDTITFCFSYRVFGFLARRWKEKGKIAQTKFSANLFSLVYIAPIRHRNDVSLRCCRTKTRLFYVNSHKTTPGSDTFSLLLPLHLSCLHPPISRSSHFFCMFLIQFDNFFFLIFMIFTYLLRIPPPNTS